MSIHILNQMYHGTRNHLANRSQGDVRNTPFDYQTEQAMIKIAIEDND